MATSPRRKRTTPAAQALAAAQAKQERRALFATAASSAASMPPACAEVFLPVTGQGYLYRRLSLSDFLLAGSAPQPCTQIVRRIIVDNFATVQGDPDPAVQKDFLDTAAALARAAILIPPDAFLDGDVEAEAVDPTGLRPMFVEANPEEGQAVLVGGHVGVPPDGTPWVRLSVQDLTILAFSLVLNAPAAVSRFRGQPDGDVGRVEPVEGEPGADEALGAA